MPLLNFFLLIGVFLLAVFWFLGLATRRSAAGPPAPCGSRPAHMVWPGDTCWAIARAAAVSLDQLLAANAGLDCDRLSVGSIVCLPEAGNA